MACVTCVSMMLAKCQSCSDSECSSSHARSWLHDVKTDLCLLQIITVDKIREKVLTIADLQSLQLHWIRAVISASRIHVRTPSSKSRSKCICTSTQSMSDK